MGFRAADAAAAVARATTHVGRGAGLEALIRAALRELDPPTPPS
jgi:hypothetical protein